MDEQQRLRVFGAQTANVRELESAWRAINKQLNALILAKDEKGVEVITRIMALLYCALAEATFSKLMHTPCALTLIEIDQIKRVATSGGVKAGWFKCAEVATLRIDGQRSSHRPNLLRKIDELIELYIFDPSQLRNKLAHGQWSVALNRENTEINESITDQIKTLNAVELYRRKFSLEKLALILEDIIESPNRAHRRDYWSLVVELESGLRQRASWTMENKKGRLFAKKDRAKCHARARTKIDVDSD